MEMLQSNSGFCMPFEEPNGEVKMSLGYGNQRHPHTGQTFFHRGVDFNVSNYLLHAVATGVVTGVGTDAEHGVYLTIRYGCYDVTYSHLAKVSANYGQAVKAGQAVALSGDMLHIGVKVDGEEIDPIDFLSAVFCNIKSMGNAATPERMEYVDFGYPIHTNYDKDREEIEELLMRFLPSYLQDLHQGLYNPTERTDLSLRNLFSMGAMKNYFYETLPSLSNPLGLGKKAIPLIEKAQNLLIADFLNYLSLRHQTGLYSSPFEKKK